MVDLYDLSIDNKRLMKQTLSQAGTAKCNLDKIFTTELD